MEHSRANLKPYLKTFYRGNHGYLALALVQTALTTAAELMIATVIQQIIDVVAGTNLSYSFEGIVWLSVGLLLLYASGSLVSYLCKPRFFARAIAQYQQYVLEVLSRKSMAAFTKESTSFYVSALSNDISAIETGYLANAFVILNQSVLLVGAIAMMFYYSPLLTALTVVLAVLPLATSLVTGGILGNAEKKVSERNEGYMGVLRDSLMGFSIIKVFRAEKQMLKNFSKEVHLLANAKEHKRKTGIMVQLCAEMSRNVLQFGVLLFGTYLALSGSSALTAGSVMVFAQLSNYVTFPIAGLSQALAERKAARALIEKMANALETNVREEGKLTKGTLERSIQLHDLSFAYEPEKRVLKHVSFTFEAGKSYCVVGGSGSGKSTLLNLLMGAQTGMEGSITYDGVNVHDLSEEALYGMVGMIQQNVFLFNASIRDNITLFSDFPKAETERAIELSGLSTLIAERGEDSLCGENCNGLSGGEKQRIAIARSLLKHSQVLLVDEATASLDKQTAYQVSSAILDLQGITRIVVTHALDEALLSRYDCILTLKNGELIETGTFDELTEKKGYFYSLYTIAQ